MIAFNKKNTDSEVRYQDLCISFYRKFSQMHLLDDKIFCCYNNIYIDLYRFILVSINGFGKNPMYDLNTTMRYMNSSEIRNETKPYL